MILFIFACDSEFLNTFLAIDVAEKSSRCTFIQNTLCLASTSVCVCACANPLLFMLMELYARFVWMYDHVKFVAPSCKK